MEHIEYKKIASRIRMDVIEEVHSAGSGHPGGSLSAADIVTALYFGEMNIDPKNPQMKGRDKFVLSKGHAAPVQYAALAEKGYFPKEELTTLRKLGSRLQGHPNMHKLPGIEMSTGSLGQGFAVCVGMAIANKIDNDPGRIYTLLGDGELQEGLIWEAAMASAHYKLDNLCVIVDWNGLQIDGRNDDVMTVSPIDEKFKAFADIYHELYVEVGCEIFQNFLNKGKTPKQILKIMNEDITREDYEFWIKNDLISDKNVEAKLYTEDEIKEKIENEGFRQKEEKSLSGLSIIGC